MILTLHCGESYFDVMITNGLPIVTNDHKYINFDKLRVKRVNRSGYFLVGEFEPFIELGDDYQVN